MLDRHGAVAFRRHHPRSAHRSCRCPVAKTPHRPFQSGPNRPCGADRQSFPPEVRRRKRAAESPAWAVDRLSILALKIYHMREQAERADADKAHTDKCRAKLNVLLEQQTDLGTAIDQLLDDIEAGRKYMKVYRQMKMYNDPSTNPVLYAKK